MYVSCHKTITESTIFSTEWGTELFEKFHIKISAKISSLSHYLILNLENYGEDSCELVVVWHYECGRVILIYFWFWVKTYWLNFILMIIWNWVIWSWIFNDLIGIFDGHHLRNFHNRGLISCILNSLLTSKKQVLHANWIKVLTRISVIHLMPFLLPNVMTTLSLFTHALMLIKIMDAILYYPSNNS